MKNMKLALAMISAAVLALGTGICTFAEDTTEAAEETAQMLQIGTKASEEDYVVTVTNETGMDITGIRISVDGEEYGENLLGDAVFEDGAQGTLHCTPKPLDAGATSAPRYDLELSYADEDRVSVIHTFPFGDCETVSFLVKEVAASDVEDAAEDTGEAAEEATEAEEGPALIAYLKFVSLSMGSEQDTYQHEEYIVYPPAVDPYAYTPSASDYSYYDGGQDYSYSEPVYEAPVYNEPAPEAVDDCMTDGLLNP